MSYLDSVGSHDSSTAGVASTGNVWSPVASGANAEETQDAIDISTDEGVIATFGGVPGAPLTYNAAGLLNAVVDAGTDKSPVANLESVAPLTTGYTDVLPDSDDSDDSSSVTPTSSQWANTYGTSTTGSRLYATV